MESIEFIEVIFSEENAKIQSGAIPAGHNLSPALNFNILPMPLLEIHAGCLLD